MWIVKGRWEAAFCLSAVQRYFHSHLPLANLQ